MNPTKNTPKEYLIYLASHCHKEIKYWSSLDIKCRDDGKYYNKQIYWYQDIVEKINLAGLKTNIKGLIT